MRRVQLAEANDLDTLFFNAVTYTQQNKARNFTVSAKGIEVLSEQRRRAVIRAVENGALSKACKLLNTPPIQSSVNVIESLEKLHPPACSIIPDLSAEVNDPFSFSAKDISRAIATFSRDAGAGPSGLRPLHLMDMCGSSEGDLLLEELSNFCSALASGTFPQDSSEMLCGARLSAIGKKDGNTIRPIAVCEVLRQLTYFMKHCLPFCQN